MPVSMKRLLSLAERFRRPAVAYAGIALWASALALWMSRGHFLLPAGQIYEQHEYHHYIYRVMEWRDLVSAGYWSPQWATHFRGGLGGPYFGYYQPGVFYVTDVFARWIPAREALGCTVFLFSLAGFAGAFALIRSRFGTLSGFLGANGLVLSPYAGTDLFVRGDVSEYAAMMVLPFALHRFADMLEEGGPSKFAGLSLAAGGLIVLHPSVGLLAALMFGVGLVGYAGATRQWRAIARTAAALALGALCASFYTLPLGLEWELVTGERVVAGTFHHHHHYVSLMSLIEPYRRGNLVPLSVGLAAEVLTVVNLVAFALFFRRTEPRQRRLFAFGLLVAILGALLMHPLAAPLWDHAPLLGLLQFCWRVLAAVTVALAVTGGAMLPWRHEGWRGAAVLLAVAGMGLLAYRYTEASRSLAYTVPANAPDIERVQYFHPDMVDEWAPRGSRNFTLEEVPKLPVASAPCQVDGFRRDQGRLSAHVATTAPCEITLPHFYFPVGWHARIDGQAVTLGRNDDGLMTVRVPPTPSGQLEVRFSMTPMRRLGWVVSLVAVLLSFTPLALAARRCGPRPAIAPATKEASL